ncbi:hypothetical protein Bsp3421_002642 [Burkholderia sp. FERM BP-3421]|jgi:hypothetical protein|uniref:hypothetical protein n=1 Tax=Burkholderia sp. FERM BP-3421 TaxID=1494466 RepID=UPI0023615FEA|nr:hypothetical protein [Burkholderia sp. FERM BP-3421]WDD92621.1 hypothetical protein Bsp3421_002642 [Burkholderia sp. FERM BP-3421]
MLIRWLRAGSAQKKAEGGVVRVMDFPSIFLDRSLVMILTGVMRNCFISNKPIQLFQRGDRRRAGAGS